MRKNFTNPRKHPQRRRERGFALLVVLWTIVLLTLMAGAFARDWRTQTRMTAAVAKSADAEAAADGGLAYAIAWLRMPEAASRPTVDGTPVEFEFAGSRVTIRIEDERGKIDLNRSGLALLRELLVDLGRDDDEIERLLDAIADYRDKDSDARPNGAEDRDYRALGLAHGAKDAPFEAVEELRQVAGMSAELFAQIRPALTVYNTSRRIAPRAASSLVRRALDIAAPEVDENRSATRSASRGTFTIIATAETPTGGRFQRRAVVRLSGARRRPWQILSFARGPYN